MINENVNGSTAVFAVIGDPIEHTSSPVIQNTFAGRLNRNMIYTAMHVKPLGLENAVKGAYELGIRGLNVTVPHKREVMKYLYAVDEKAEQIGAVNTLKYTENGYVGYNTDILGISQTLKEAGKEIKDKNILLLGAGGAAYAAAVLSASEGCKRLFIANRTVENAERLKEHIQRYYNNEIIAISLSEIEKIQCCDIVFNATTVGFGDKTGQSPIQDLNFYKNKNVNFVFDIIYTPWETQLIKDARKCGVEAVNGFPMLVYQAAGAQEIWFEEEIPSNIKFKLKDELSDYYRR